jgi:hypothetical protein
MPEKQPIINPNNIFNPPGADPKVKNLVSRKD